MINTPTILTAALCGVFLVASLPDADAATIRVRCEKRADRSKVSVDGNDVAKGKYKAKISSGPNRRSSPFARTIGDEVEFDFDSEPDDIADGATAIDSTFIRKNKVTGKIVNSRGHTVISDTVNCRQQSTTSSCVPAPMSSLVVNPRNAPYNAKGDGATNDTAALQKAVDAVGGTGGTLLVPAGTYMIDASTHLSLKANMTLSLAPDATLKAIPNGLEGYAVILVNGVDHVNVVGGALEGERDNHTGTTGEWGMGLKINNAQHVVVEGVTAKECWGDGFYVGGASSADVTFCNVVADHNRRQGMSVTSVDGLVVRDSVFKNTAGTLPETGLDIEPNRGETVTNALVAQCTFTNNAGGGLQVGPAGVDMAVTFVTNMVAERNTFRGNGRGAIRLSSCTGNIIRDNRVEDNFGVGISVLYTTGSVVTGNTVMRTKLAGSGNERGAGIILENDKGTVCSGNTVTGNEGHGIFTWKSNATVTGNTVSGNGPTP
jgi:parallel beta-helix repeat protein